jgi:hypothetical protein
LSPEKLGFIHVNTLVIARSAIGVICATADVRIFVNNASLANVGVVFIVGIVRKLVIAFAVIVTEILLFAGI